MKKEELIKKLQELPDGIEVCIFDWKLSAQEADGEPSSTGIYPKFDIEIMANEYLENGKEPFALLSFENLHIDLDE